MGGIGSKLRSRAQFSHTAPHPCSYKKNSNCGRLLLALILQALRNCGNYYLPTTCSAKHSRRPAHSSDPQLRKPSCASHLLIQTLARSSTAKRPATAEGITSASAATTRSALPNATMHWRRNTLRPMCMPRGVHFLAGSAMSLRLRRVADSLCLRRVAESLCLRRVADSSAIALRLRWGAFPGLAAMADSLRLRWRSAGWSAMAG